MTAMGKEHVDFFEGTFIKQHVNAFTAGIATFSVMLFYRRFATTCIRFFTVLDEFLQFRVTHNVYYLGCWQISVRTPFVLLGCRKAIIKFSAPLRGAWSIS